MKKRHLFVKLAQHVLVGNIFLIFAPGHSQSISFSDISGSRQVAGYWQETAYVFGHGVAFADLNGDSRPELYVSNAAEGSSTYPDLLYINRADKSWLEQAAARGLADDYGIGSHGLVFFDMDNDGDFDVYNGNTYQAPYSHAWNRLYRNTSSGNFQDVTGAAGLPDSDSGTRSVAAFDANNDGLIDLFSVGSKTLTYAREPYRFYLNQGNGTFKAVDWGTAAMAEDGFGPNGLTIADFDNDGDQEIYVARVDRAQKGARANNQLLDKGADGVYRDLAGVLNVRGCGWSDGATFADFDTDGDLDLFVASSNDKKLQRLYVYRNNGNGTFTDLTADWNIYQQGFSPLLFDVDNDGDLDLYTPSKDSTPQYNRLYLNNGHGGFVMAEGTGLEVALFDPRGAATADIDGDGDLDLYVTDTNKGFQSRYSNHLFRNNYAGSNRWLKISGRGPKGDQGAFGSKIWLYEKDHLNEQRFLLAYKQIISTYGFCCQDDPVQHFGLGERDTVAVCIRMTDGTTLQLPRVAAKRTLFFSKPNTLYLAGGDGQSVTAGQVLPQPLQIKVTDAYGQPVAGVGIDFSAQQGRLIPAGTIYTDVQGAASAAYAAGTTAGTEKVLASSPLLSGQRLEFNVIVKAKERVAARILPISLPEQHGTVATRLADSISVQTVDEEGWPVAGVPVLFRISAGAGKANDQDSVWTETRRDGHAAVAWQLGARSGPHSNELVVLAQGVAGSPVYFTADSQPGAAQTIIKKAGDEQVAPVRRTLDSILVVAVTDSFANPLSDVVLYITEKQPDGASFAWPDLVTDGQGRCTWRWTLGAKTGTYQLVVQTEAGLMTQFRARAMPRTPAVMIVAAGNEQTGKPGLPLAEPLTVQVLDRFSEPVAGASVRFTIIKGGGRLSAAAPVLTDSSGLASIVWTLGDGDEQRAGAQVVDYGQLKAVFDAVRRVNHPPAITQYIPADSVLALSRYACLFSVAVDDIDSDSVSYVWTVNGVTAAYDSVFQFKPVPGQRNGTTVVVQVDDGESVVQHGWVLYYPTDIDPNQAQPLTFALEQNFPNPFNPATTVRFALAEPGRVQLRIYDELGCCRRTLLDGVIPAGVQQVTWDARDDSGRPLGAGIYLCRLQGPEFVLTRKLLYIK